MGYQPSSYSIIVLEHADIPVLSWWGYTPPCFFINFNHFSYFFMYKSFNHPSSSQNMYYIILYLLVYTYLVWLLSVEIATIKIKHFYLSKSSSILIWHTNLSTTIINICTTWFSSIVSQTFTINNPLVYFQSFNLLATFFTV